MIMTTMVVRVESGTNIKNIAAAMRLLKGVSEVKVQKEKRNAQIPGLPYTQDERIAAIHKAEEDYVFGRYVTSDELRKKHPRL
jgi:hypothetical protein